MSVAEDSRLLEDTYHTRAGRPQLFTRIGLAIKNMDYTQLYRRQPLKGIGGAYKLVSRPFMRLVREEGVSPSVKIWNFSITSFWPCEGD